MRLSKKLTMIVVTAGVGTGAAIGITQAAGDPPAPPWQPATTSIPTPATAAQKAAFPVLATQPRAATDDHAQVAAFAARAQIGADAGGARTVGSTTAGPIWLIPVAGGLCLALEETADTSIGTACEDTDTVIARGTTIGDGTNIYGIVPAGTTSVTVTPAGGTPAAVPVSANGIYTLPFEDATVTLDGPSGRTEFGVAD